VEGIAAVTGVLSVLAKPLKTTMRNYYVYNAIGYAWRFIFGSGLAYITANSVGEGRFVARNPVVKELVRKKVIVGRKVQLHSLRLCIGQERVSPQAAQEPSGDWIFPDLKLHQSTNHWT
jgi:hypothetical protein